MKKLLLLLSSFSLLGYSQVQIGSDIIDSTQTFSRFGHSVSLSSDGNIIAVGANNSDVNGTNSGIVKVYENQNGTWIQIGADIIGEDARNELGHSVSLSNDGTIVAIGAVGDENGSDPGTLKVFENQNGTWTQIGTNIDGDSNGDEFGHSVSISGDGSVVAVGANNHFFETGQVKIFENQSGIWTQLGSDIDGEESFSESGFSVNLSNDGSIIAIGAPLNNESANDAGHVRVFENQGGSWVQLGEDIDGEAAGDESGHSVSLSMDGSKIAIGAPFNDGNGNDSGHVRIFENQSGTWTQIGDDIDGEAANNESGFSVSLSADGTKVAIGATGSGETFASEGQFRLYENQNGTWIQVGSDINGDVQGDNLGTSVSLSDDGSIAAIGVPGLLSNVQIYDYSATLESGFFSDESFEIVVDNSANRIYAILKNMQLLEFINLYAVNGKYILTVKQPVIDTSELSPGIYIMEVETSIGKSAKKVIID